MPSQMSSQAQTLFLPRPLVNKILAHAQQNPNIEVCGLIGAIKMATNIITASIIFQKIQAVASSWMRRNKLKP